MLTLRLWVCCGVPIGLHVDSAQPHELTLVETTLCTIFVPRNGGCPKARPQELVADKAYDSADFRRKLRRWGIKPNSRSLSGANATSPSVVGLSVQEQASANAGKSSAASAGWTVVGVWWCARTVICISTVYRAFCLDAVILWCVNRILKCVLIYCFCLNVMKT